MVKVLFYSSKQYDIESFQAANSSQDPLELTFHEHRLDPLTARLAKGYDAVCIFVNDGGDAEVLEALRSAGVKYIALRCAGFNNVDLKTAHEIGLKVVRVPAYSPEAVAEFTIGMILTVIRKYHKAYNRVRESNFTLSGLVGSNIQSKTIGIIGTGKIGILAGQILSLGFRANVIAYDPYPNPPAAEKAGIKYVTLDELLKSSDIISLHCPLMESTKYIINDETLSKTKRGFVLINTSRGALVDTKALIRALKSDHVGAVGIDVYEGEEEYFFKDSSEKIMQDDVLGRLLSFYNVFVSGHQAFLTVEALNSIAATTLDNLHTLEKGEECKNVV